MKIRPLTGGIMPIEPKFYFAPDGEGGGGEGEGDAAAAAAAEAAKGGEGEGSGEGEAKPTNLAEFNLKFSAKNASPHLAGGAPSQADIDLVKKNSESRHIVDDSPPEGETPEQKAIRERQRRPGSNVPKIVEDKRKAEQERDAAKADYEKYKTETETRITELQAKIDSGKLSEEREKQYSDRIIDLEASIQTEREELTKKNKDLQSRLSLYDIQQDPQFEKDYIDPVRNSFNDVADTLGADNDKQELLNRALMANAASLRAKTPESKRVAERERDTILSQIEEDLPGFTGKRFAAAMGDYILATKRHAQALENHEVTAQEIRERVKAQRNESFSKTIETWGRAFDNTGKAYDEELSLTKEEKDAAKELGINLDEELKKTAVKAKKAVSGQAAMEESIELLHEGRLAPAYKARIKVQASKIAALESLVAKLRKGGTGGGTGGAGGGAGAGEGDGKPTREEWQRQKFGANRPGLQH
jgi:hypothetical protein